MKKVLVVGSYPQVDSSYYRPFKAYGPQTSDISLLDSEPDCIRLAVFTGGEDVNPSLYNEERNSRTYDCIERDNFEKSVFDKLVQLNIPLFGICRGAQFLCVMAGGKLCQHLDNHSGYHDIETHDGRYVQVNSTHHQMQLPPKNAEVIAWAHPSRSKRYLGGGSTAMFPEKEYEIVYYPGIKALATQYHPESMATSSEGWTYYQELIAKYLEISEQNKN